MKGASLIFHFIIDFFAVILNKILFVAVVLLTIFLIAIYLLVFSLTTVISLIIKLVEYTIEKFKWKENNTCLKLWKIF